MYLEVSQLIMLQVQTFVLWKGLQPRWFDLIALHCFLQVKPCWSCPAACNCSDLPQAPCAGFCT